MLTGFVSQAKLNDYLAACDILWLPLSDTIANRGRWPSKIVDYFAAGRPTVACAVGDIAALLERTEAGVACAPTSSEFARQTLHLLKDNELLARFSINARRAAESDFNWEHLAKLVETQYLDLL
jgi:glycosyltransferase involved in cell wall biosynthesis